MSRALLDRGPPRLGNGEELLCFLWKCHSLRESLAVLVKAQQGTKKRLEKEKASKKDRKVSLKRKTLSSAGAALRLWGVKESSEALTGT